MGSSVNLDLRHLGAQKIHERLPLITEVARTFMGVDPVTHPIPVRPAVHYTMGGIASNRTTETTLEGLYVAGECASVGIHGANRLGSNSLAEIVVFGKVAGEHAARFARSQAERDSATVRRQAEAAAARLLALLDNDRGERVAVLRDEMGDTMEAGVGIYRSATACNKPATSWPSCVTGIGVASSSMTGIVPSIPSGCRRSSLVSHLRWQRRWPTRRLGRQESRGCPCAARRIQDPRRREFPAALFGTLYRRRPAVDLAGSGHYHQVATSHAQLWRRGQEGGDDMTTF
jgi:hypothetical protein